MKVAAIVPAFNEEGRISKVLEAIKAAEMVDEIVVVNDGSTDGTYELVAADPAVKAVNLQANRGKGGAMRAGAHSTDADIILFLDADLVGMDGEKVDAIVRPVAEDQADMAIGIFKGGRRSTDFAQFVTPYISGQRALRREVFLSIPKIDNYPLRGGNRHHEVFQGARAARAAGATSGMHTLHERRKTRLREGFASRMRMYDDIGKILLDGKELKRR